MKMEKKYGDPGYYVLKSGGNVNTDGKNVATYCVNVATYCEKVATYLPFTNVFFRLKQAIRQKNGGFYTVRHPALTL
ncbi:MAG: hypothetical protein LBL07_04510 [Tannerella sp.]|jgi:hypothetical protein|nr:hypothetical protein [Tannerella sp.]